MLNKNMSPLITFLSLLIMGLFWLFTINGLPMRVRTLEENVKVLEKKMEKNDVKTDIILDTVKLIQAHLFHLQNNGVSYSHQPEGQDDN